MDAILLAAQNCESNVELLLVDNGGLDSALPRIQERTHHLIRMVGNVRLCRARNLAAAYARGPVLVFI
ncbi:MAG: glycosyltransferase, partial [Planctomycetota bacterium]|nr:glycosyltransferase [Planctomycetota bacterium]